MHARSCRLARLALVLSGWAVCGATVPAEPGVTENAVTFGQSGCFSGPCETEGLNYRTGILAAFHERNREGGVGGRELKLISRDDGYDPNRATTNVNWLINSGEVFAVIGAIGTPTARRMASPLRGAKIPFIGHLTGADFLSDADRYPNVVNVRSAYAEETRQLVAYMFNGLGARRFGIIYQDDSFGRSVLASYAAALKDFGLPILAKASYSRHTHAVHASVFVMEKADLDAVMLATSTGPAAEAINTARSLGHGYTVGVLSIVNPARLRALLDHSEERMLLSSVTPDATDDSVTLVRRFHQALAAYGQMDPQAVEYATNARTLEGYILGRFVIEVLARMPGEPNRAMFLATALAPEPVVFDDWVIAFKDGSNVGSDYVRLVDFSDEGSTREAAE